MKSIGDIVRDGILARLPDSYIIAAVVREHPEARTTRKTVAWYRSELRRLGAAVLSPMVQTVFRLVGHSEGHSADPVCEDFLALTDAEAVARGKDVAHELGMRLDLLELTDCRPVSGEWLCVVTIAPEG